MTLKSIRNSLGLLLALSILTNARAGLIASLQDDHGQDLHNHHPHHHEVSVASSYMHFHGPVEGPEFEVKVPYIEPHHHHESHDEHNHLLHHDQHQGYVMDYVAHPKYQFSYGVEDHHTGDFHSQKESRDGSSVSGEYSVAEPGGSIRVVSYRADKDGFHAVVHTSGKNDHSGGTYGYQGHHQQVEHHHQPTTIELNHGHSSHLHEQESEGLEQTQQHQQLLQEYSASFPTHEEGSY